LESSFACNTHYLNLFSAKGTGKDEKEALIVDGKLSKIGTKRKLFALFLSCFFIIIIFFYQM